MTKSSTAGRLVGDALGSAVGVINDIHEAVSGRVFQALGSRAEPVRVVHDTVTKIVYGGVKAGHLAVPRAAGLLARNADLEAHPAARFAVLVANGIWGDTVAAGYPELHLPMAVRSGNRDVPLRTADLGDAHPGATGRLVVLVHGLCESDHSWHPGEPGSFGARLREDLGLTPVHLRFNTGLHISDNGRALSELLTGLVEAWPVPVTELVLVGHSMGGLVLRSACHQGSDQPWLPLVSHVVFLGTPHLGAPLEQTVHAAAWLLRKLPETRPVSRLLDSRSVGVKDLRHGALVEQDWVTEDPAAWMKDGCTDVPLLANAKHSWIGVTIAKDPGSPLGRVVGDAFVLTPSASGHGRRRRIGFGVDSGVRLGGLHHFDLLGHPDVYAQLHRMLTS